MSTYTQRVLEELRKKKVALRPSEIAEELGINKNTVKGIVQKLYKEGLLLKEDKGKYRAK